MPGVRDGGQQTREGRMANEKHADTLLTSLACSSTTGLASFAAATSSPSGGAGVPLPVPFTFLDLRWFCRAMSSMTSSAAPRHCRSNAGPIMPTGRNQCASGDGVLWHPYYTLNTPSVLVALHASGYCSVQTFMFMTKDVVLKFRGKHIVGECRATRFCMCS
jgi:hypothetical protein